ncbi:MAG: hypothetical protein LLF92_07565 [Planctomycetaceae bacterium]|nr:hypothetical protein [Planctomycetaceae bacterium]
MKLEKYFIVVLFLLCVGSCYANPIIMPPPKMGMYSFETKAGLIINFVADFAAISIGYWIAREIRRLFCRRFFPYIVMVFLGGIIIDIIAVFPFKVFFYIFQEKVQSIMVLFLTAGLLLYLFNSWLAEKLFEVELKEKIIIGLVMALLTNPVIGILLSN